MLLAIINLILRAQEHGTRFTLKMVGVTSTSKHLYDSTRLPLYDSTSPTTATTTYHECFLSGSTHLNLLFDRLSLKKLPTMLPYNTIGHAEVAMNRTLTFAETIWYNYSANKSDYYLYCHNIIFLFLVSSFIPLPLVVIELLGLPNIKRYKIQPNVRLSFAEMMSCYKTVMQTFFFAVGPLQLASYPFIKVFHSPCLFYFIFIC